MKRLMAGDYLTLGWVRKANNAGVGIESGPALTQRRIMGPYDCADYISVESHENIINHYKQENAQLKASMDDSIRAHRVKINDLQKQIAEYACVEAERDKLKVELAQCRQDIKDAAGELVVPMPAPGTDMAKLLSANIILRQRAVRLREVLRELSTVVRGECPSLLNEDSGGDAELALEIERAIEEDKA